MMALQKSRQVRSSQKDIHPRLEKVLDAHLTSEWRQPLHQPSVDAFKQLDRLLAGRRKDLVLDSGCGAGESTRLLARAMPDCLVVGVDKSISRLARISAGPFPYSEGNAIWLRAELPTFWRLALAAGWRLHRHYLLYPNPWPKPGDLQRRWHGHPVFPALLQLGGRLEMRCNWEIYAREFAFAVNHVLGTSVEPGAPPGTPDMSLFERKYRNSGHALYSVSVDCDSSGVK
jgi:tRNA G46 methylase TrmB